MSENRKKVAKKIREQIGGHFSDVDMFDVIPMRNGPRGDVYRWDCLGWGCVVSLRESALKKTKLYLSETEREIYAIDED